MLRRLIIPMLCLALVACRGPESYPPPAQFVMPSGPEPPATMPDPNRLLIAMADLDWKSHVIDGVLDGPDSENYRWCHPRALFRLTPTDIRSLVFYTRFILIDAQFRPAGVVTLTISINGHTLDRARFVKSGDQEYLRPVPEGWLTAGEPVIITLDLAPPLPVANGDQLGVLLHSIGFRK